MRRSSFLIRVIGIGVLLHIYVGSRLIPEWPFGTPAKAAAVVWLVLSCVLIPLGVLARYFVKRQRLADRMAWIGLLVMGYFSSLLVITFVRDLSIASLLTIDSLLPRTVSLDRWRVDSAVGVPLLAMISTAIGFINARRRAKVASVDIPIADLPPELDGLTIVQISDIHVGPTIKRSYVEAIVAEVNRLEADVIAVTGDVVDGSVAQLAEHTRPLGRLKAKYGAFLVTGNHEYYSGAEEWIAEFQRLGLQVLLNDHVVLEHNGAPFVVAGVTDYSAGHFNDAHRSDPAAAVRHAPDDARIRVLLAHQPRSALAAAEAGYTLQLSGHTHGGQFFPWNFFVRFQQPFTAGLARIDDLWIYTSRGTGYWGPPKRLGAPSEITRIRLVADTRVPGTVSGMRKGNRRAQAIRAAG
ncbi:metallophosphoesterase [Paraburkholderia sp. NMBU_R16]|uniref:metallophosphoesterase n=1 Tax=Paraburkholderia sp. NMBU_R16 TaxID=2698676 RepID=UPI0015677399|nr:metallophosphoesterase [Paraburkholderia sp. NMBU_R16]NRO99339.1 metallophosphoesterase [Paraburkholderia sp. NMBU_R16]